MYETYTGLPMVMHHINLYNMQLLLSSLGGFWASISSITFLFLSMFLYEHMLKQEAKVIWEDTIVKRAEDRGEAWASGVDE